ncbi:MAG: glycosyltransferase [Phenylobacterium sp.]|uniref:glycosyltransferase n=1 Tax=Phenylobacterium sp. TaxID=1871053 RepID=UPI0039190DD0
MSDAASSNLARTIRLDPADAPHFGAPGRQGFHLIDTTMMFAPRSGGVKRYLLAKNAWLAAHRPDVRHTLVVPGPKTAVGPGGLVTIAAARLPFGDGYRMPASAMKWESMLRLLEPEIIEAGDVLVPGHAALDAGEALGVPVVGYCHTDAAALAALHLGDWAEAPAMKRWAQAYRRFDRVVAPSRHMAGRLAEAGVRRVTVQPLGVDVELFHPARGDPGALRRRLGVPARTRLLVFAGRPAREKNIESLVCAVERLGDPYRLLLVGAGRDARYSRHVTALDYERDPAALAALMAGCDAFVHGNANEPFGLVVLEAMAAGLPVVGPAAGGVGELIDETVGQPAAGDEPADLAEAIEALFARDLSALSAAARRRAETRHAWNTTFEGLTRLYGGLLSGGAGRGSALALSA